MKKSLLVIFAAFSAAALAAGCSQKTVDTNKPVEQIESEVQSMSREKVESFADAYAQEIGAKTEESRRLAAELKAIPLKDQAGDAARKIQMQLSQLNVEAASLIERFDVYARKLKELGGDVSKYKVGK